MGNYYNYILHFCFHFLDFPISAPIANVCNRLFSPEKQVTKSKAIPLITNLHGGIAANARKILWNKNMNNLSNVMQTLCKLIVTHLILFFSVQVQVKKFKTIMTTLARNLKFMVVALRCCLLFNFIIKNKKLVRKTYDEAIKMKYFLGKKYQGRIQQTKVFWWCLTRKSLSNHSYSVYYLQNVCDI